MFPPSVRPGFRSKLKTLLSVLIVSVVVIGIYPFADDVWGVITQGGSSVTLNNVLDENFNLSLDGYLEGSQLISTTSGSNPLLVESSDLVENLNADLLDGQHGSYYLNESDLNWDDLAGKPSVISSLDGVTNDSGNIDFLAGANVTITPDNVANTITIAGSEGVDGWLDDGAVVRLETATDKVGIGTISPDGTLHVQTGSAGAVTAHAFYDDLVVENAGDAGISILTPNASYGGLIFGSPSSNIRGWIKYYGTSNTLQFGQNGSDHMWLTDSELEFQQATGISTTSGDLTLDPSGNVFIPSDLSLAGTASIVGPVDSTAFEIGNSATEGGNVEIFRDASGNRQVFIDADAAETSVGTTLYGRLQVGSTAAVILQGNNGTIATSTGDLTLNPAGSANVHLDASTKLTIGTSDRLQIYHDTSGHIINSFNALEIQNTAASSVVYLRTYNNASQWVGLNLYGALQAVVVNEDSLDVDFRVEGNNDANLLFTDGGNDRVGIGTATPGQKLEVNGGVRLNTATAQPTCDSSARGTLWFTQGGAGVKDELEVCAKDAGDAYAWRTIY
ncbi:hypothetical protein A2155_00905 [candidate division WWE3 bacterium RBG_16_52_45]|nr:MAG: hypothetical protein A2155_00905 [candidate division WWE3 bacterium RBG_16_52_45]